MEGLSRPWLLSADSWLSSGESEPRSTGLWPLLLTLAAMTFALLLAWGRLQQRHFLFAAPVEVETSAVHSYTPLAHRFRVASCGEELWAMIVSVLSYLLLALGVFVMFSVILSWRMKGTGPAAFWACFMRLAIGLAAAGVVLGLFSSSLRHLRQQPMHPSHFQVAEDERPKMVEQWRMDALSLLEERLELLARHGRAMAASLRARAHMPLLVAGRMAFLRDMMCDAMVARMLWNQQRHLAIAVLCILGLPYVALPCLLGMQNTKQLLLSLHPSFPLDVLSAYPVIEGMAFLCLAAPTFVLVDIDFVAQYWAREPQQPRLFHFWTLRLLVEDFWESNLQVALQSYIFLRQENPFHLFPEEHVPSVDRWILAASIIMSAKATVDGLRKLCSFANLQTSGNRLAFCRAMICGGDGLAPSNLLQELQCRAEVTVEQDLSDLSLSGWDSICRAARQSTTLRVLRFNGAFLGRFHDQVAARNALELIFQNQKLEDLEVSELPIFYQARAEAFRRSHPWLRGSDLRGQLAAWPSLQDAYPALVGGTSALEMAAQLGEARAVQALLRHGLHGTPLIDAAEEGHASCVELLMLAGARVEEEDPGSGLFPLLMAAQNGHQECVQLLLSAQADPQQEKNGLPLVRAAQNGHDLCVKLLLDARAEAARSDQQGIFPLLVAAQNGHQRCLQLLVASEADPAQVNPANGSYPLAMAAQNGHHLCVEDLLKLRANPSQTNELRGTFPLLLAAKNGHEHCVKHLISAGCEPLDAKRASDFR